MFALQWFCFNFPAGPLKTIVTTTTLLQKKVISCVVVMKLYTNLLDLKQIVIPVKAIA